MASHYGGDTYKVHTNTLIIMQKKIIRAMTNSYYLEHTHPLFIRLNLIRLEDIYRIEVLKFMYKYVNKMLPESLLNIFTHTTNIHNYETRQMQHLRCYRPRTNLSMHSLLYNGPKFWNDISPTSHNARTIKQFSSILRSETLQLYINTN